MDRAIGSLQGSNTGITIQSHDEQVSLGTCILQVLNMPGVQYVEAAVGKGHPLPQPAPAVQLMLERFPVENFLVAARTGTQQIAKDFVTGYGSHADLLHLQAAGNIGQANSGTKV